MFSNVKLIKPLYALGKLKQIECQKIAVPKSLHYVGRYTPDMLHKISNMLAVTDPNRDIVWEGLRRFLLQIYDGVDGIDHAACYVNVCLQKPTTQHQLPSWHQDGWMFAPGMLSFKYVATICGPSTRFLVNPDDVLDMPQYLGEYIIEPGRVMGFTCGMKDSPLHSSPNITEDRIFISLIPGSPSQLRKLAELRGLSVDYSLC